MTAPTLVDNGTTPTATASTTHTVQLPTTVSVGQRLAVLWAEVQSGAIVDASDFSAWDQIHDQERASTLRWAGWTIYVGDTGTATDLSNAVLEIEVADSRQGTAQVLVIGGASSGGEGVGWAAQLGTYAFTNTPNPPSLTAPWGSADTLWVAAYVAGNTGANLTTPPTGYTTIDDGTVATSVTIGTAYRAVTASAEDPGQFEIDDPENTLTLTLAFAPAAAATPTAFRSQQTLATTGQPVHVLTALGYTSTATITRADLDDILDDWVASTGGTTFEVTDSTEWNAARAAAVGGDLIRATATFDPTGDQVSLRGNRYGISGSNLTASPSGGDEGLPIICTCADGVYLDANNTSSNTAVLDLQNCTHVWAVGMNVRDGQFGIRCMNWGGTEAAPAYVAYCDIQNIGHAGLAAQGWFQLITSSGGTPPAGSGNEWGYSEWFVFESNTIDGVGVIADQFGEAIYLGRGSTPGWVSFARNFWVRGNDSADWTSDGIDVKPGCHYGAITDNAFHLGHAESGAPLSILYVGSTIDDRPAWADFDPEIYVEGNRVYDSNLTNTDGASVNIMGYIGLSGVRIANNIFWAHPQSGTHATWRVRIEKGTNDATALAQFRADPTWVVNNTCWGDDSFENAGYGVPFVGPMPGTITFDLRNNIVDQASPATGEVDAAASDFVGTVPAIGVVGAADAGYGDGSAFELAASSSLVATGSSIADLDLLIDADIVGRSIPAGSPNPGAFQAAPVGAPVDVDVAAEADTAGAITPLLDGAAVVTVGTAAEADTAGVVLAVGIAAPTATFPVARLDVTVELAAPIADPIPRDLAWVDVSAWLLAQRTTIKRGRADESARSQPAQIGVALDATDGEMMPGNPRSSFWPLLSRGTLVRVSCSGTEPALVLDGSVDASAETLDLAGAFPDGFDIRVLVDPEAWSVGAQFGASGTLTSLYGRQCLASQYDTSTNERAWALEWFGAGWPLYFLSADGAVGGGVLSDQLLGGLGPTWVAYVLDGDTGAGGHRMTVYTWPGDSTPPDDVTTWDLVATVDAGGAYGLHPSTAPVRLGGRSGTGTQNGLAARFLRAEFRAVENGPLLACPDFTTATPGTTGFVDGCGVTWVLTGAAEVTTRRTRFVGNIDDLSPAWPAGDNYASTSARASETRVAITSSGISRRLSQGSKPLLPTLARHITGDLWRGQVVAYWPCLDPDGAAQFSAGIPTHGAAQVSAEVDLAADSTLVAAGTMPRISGDDIAAWSGTVPTPPDFNDAWQVFFLYRLQEGPASPDRVTLLEVEGLGTVRRWLVQADEDTLYLTGQTENGTTLVSTSSGIPASFYGDQWMLAMLDVAEVLGDVDVELRIVDLTTSTGATLTGSTPGTVGRVGRVGTRTAAPGGLSFGHVVVTDGTMPLNWLAGADTAWAGESAAHRIMRLCLEQRVPVTIVADPGAYVTAGTGLGDLSRSQAVGPQRQATFLDLLHQAAAVDRGVLIERPGHPGFLYRPGVTLDRQEVRLPLDAAANHRGDIIGVEPMIDDQRLRNDVTVSATNGGAAQVTDEASIADNGLYDVEVEVAGVGGVRLPDAAIATTPGLAAAQRHQNYQLAGLILALGTLEGTRWPTVEVDLGNAPDQIDNWHDLHPGDRVTLVNLPEQQVEGTIELLVEGIDERLSPTMWRPVLTCSPGEPWLTGRLADDHGTDVDGAARLSGPLTLDGDVDATTDVLPIDGDHTDDPADYPLLVEVGGELVLATGAVSGALTGCTRAVNGVAKGHTAGAEVTIVESFRLAFGHETTT